MLRNRPHGPRGSSPLTRGKRRRGPTVRRQVGLIPAHAGKTNVDSWLVCVAWAHPRSRGENPSRKFALPLILGSSPLTRGKRYSVQRVTIACGLIPAHAGKTLSLPFGILCDTAHPRSRGENEQIAAAQSAGDGSSPLTRGKRFPGLVASFRQGLIPAHAGKTVRRRSFPGLLRAHPRSRGENRVRGDRAAIHRGSSPLTRGKPLAAGLWVGRGRLIPAHAGKTRECLRRRRACRAHPRSRGEN